MNKEVLSKIDRSIETTIWITESSIDTIPAGFEEFDYLSDGLLSAHCRHFQGTESKQTSSLFSFDNFGKQVHLIQVCAGSEMKGRIDQYLQVLQKNLDSDKIIFIKPGHIKLDKKYNNNFINL